MTASSRARRCRLVNPCTIGAGLYDHDYGTDAAFYIVDLPPQ